MAARFTAPNLSLRDWVLRELRQGHVGAANAVTWEALGWKARAAGYRVGRDERNLREEVNALQAGEGQGALIVGSTRPPYGVYIATTLAEVRAYLAQSRSRATALWDKARHQERAAEAEFLAQAVQAPLL